MRYLISIDGGGTKTEGVCVNSLGSIVGRDILGSSNPNDVGYQTSIEVISGLVNTLLPSDATEVQIAIGGSGMKTAGIEDQIKQELLKTPCVNRVEVLSDVLTAYHSACDDKGAILIIGTGCVGYVNDGVKEYFVGGGGHFIDRLCSGFDLGRGVINAVLEDQDGRGQPTMLTQLFTERVGSGAREHLKEVYAKGKSYVASFAPLLFTAYEKNDKVASDVLCDCVKGLDKVLNAMHKIYGKDTLEVTVFGGLTKKLEVIESFLTEQTRNKVRLLRPNAPIIFGGIKLLAKVDEQFAKNFIEDYNK